MNAISAVAASVVLLGANVQSSEPAEDPPPIVLVENLDPAAWPQDPVAVLQVHVYGDDLRLTVSYTGGCARHRFDLAVSSRFLESEPPKVDALLAHDAGADACRTLITEDLAFDLAPLRDHYRESYRRRSGTVVLILRGLEIPYSF